MADTPYKAQLTRVHWAGADATTDEHLEVYLSEVESRFEYNAIFRAFSTERSVANQSNTYRIDRLGTSQVKGRKSGEALEAQRVTNEKLILQVDTVLYIRNPIDYQDDWTAPDWLMDIARNNGYTFAEVFDQAHLIQLIKARKMTTPEHLKPGIGDGIEVTGEFKAAAKTQAELEANAIAINLAHKKGIDTLIKNKVPLADMITIVHPDIYSSLLEHPKLLNIQFDNTNGGLYSGRRFVRMNGIPVIESTAFPDNAITGTFPLGADYNVDAEDLKCKMVTFSKSKTLVTVKAKDMTVRVWDDEMNFQNVLDAYCMYNVGIRRPDACVVTKFEEPA
jgi:hypothetical protein